MIDVVDPTPPTATLPTGAFIDQNNRNVWYAITDDASQTVVPITTDSDGNIVLDLVFE